MNNEDGINGFQRASLKKNYNTTIASSLFTDLAK